MHREYILLNGFRKAKKGFTAGFHVPLTSVISKLLQTITLDHMVDFLIKTNFINPSNFP